jgi:hypothetical protein
MVNSEGSCQSRNVPHRQYSGPVKSNHKTSQGWISKLVVFGCIMSWLLLFTLQIVNAHLVCRTDWWHHCEVDLHLNIASKRWQ